MLVSPPDAFHLKLYFCVDIYWRFEAYIGQYFDHPLEIEHDCRHVCLYTEPQQTHIMAANESMPLFGFAEFALNLVAFLFGLLILRCFQEAEKDFFVAIFFMGTGLLQ